jgi:hypothetical protein
LWLPALRQCESTAQRFEQDFFLFLSELGERVEGSEISAQRGGGEGAATKWRVGEEPG